MGKEKAANKQKKAPIYKFVNPKRQIKRVQKQSFIEPNDNTITSAKRGYNQHLSEKMPYVKSMGDWRRAHPTLAEFSDELAAAPFYLNPITLTGYGNPMLQRLAYGALGGIGGWGEENQKFPNLTKSFNEYTGLDLPDGSVGAAIGSLALPWITKF